MNAPNKKPDKGTVLKIAAISDVLALAALYFILGQTGMEQTMVIAIVIAAGFLSVFTILFLMKAIKDKPPGT